MSDSLFEQPQKERLFDDAYSKRVKKLKYIIPLLILIITGFLIIWPMITSEAIPETTEKNDPTHGDQQSMLKPVFQGLDQKQRPYTITAEEVSRISNDSAAMRLKSPNSILYMTIDQAEWMALQSHFGTYDPNDQTLLMEGNVLFTDWRGMKMMTHILTMDLTKKNAISNTNVVGYGDDASIRAEGLTISESGKKLVFKGPATLRLKNNEKQAQ